MMKSLKRPLIVSVMLVCLPGVLPALAEEEKPKDNPAPALAVAELKRTDTVDFEKEILPILKNNCLACHNQTKAKGDLILETPQTILKGGETGPAVVAGKSGESLLLAVATHAKKPHMPPKDNKVNASELSPEELALVKLWIDQGAKGEVHAAGPIEWQPLPAGLNPIYAVAVAPDGQFAACGRANQIFIYHVPSGQLVGRLTDPQLIKEGLYGKPGAAHRDLVQSLAFSPDGDLLASGSFREVKLWRRPRNVQKLTLTTSNVVTSLAASADGRWLATGDTNGAIKLFDLNDGKEAKVLNVHTQAVTALKFSADNARLLSSSADRSLCVWNLAEGTLHTRAQTSNEVNAVAWVGVSNQLASAGADKLIQLWQVTEGTNAELKLVREFSGHEGTVTALDAWPDGKQILSGSMDGSVRVWNGEDAKLVREVKHGGAVAAVAVQPDGQRFASAGLNNVARLWNAADGKAVAEMKGDRYAQELAAELERALAFAKSEVDYRKTTATNAEKEDKTRAEKLVKASETNNVAEKAFAEKQKTLKEATENKTATEKALADLNTEIKNVTESFQEADKLAKQTTAQANCASNSTARRWRGTDCASRMSNN